MAYIVHGATGAQGSPVLHNLRAAGKEVIAAVRHVDSLPEDIRGVSVDLADGATLTQLYHGAEGVFIHLPLTDPAQASIYAQSIGDALHQAGPSRVVISTSGAVIDSPNSPLQAPPESPICQLISRAQDSGCSIAIVAPRLFLENLLLPVVIGPVKAEKTLRYPLPADYAVSWSSHQDVAAVATHLLLNAEVTGVVSVGQLPGVTGDMLAESFGAHLGTPVRYEGITPAEFGALIAPILGPAAATVVALYEALNSEPAFTIPEDNNGQRLLGIEPMSIPQWLSNLPTEQ